MKILLVEDDAVHVNYLKEIVHAALPDATEILVASNGREGEIKARQFKVPAIVMDLRMKERNGIEAARRSGRSDRTRGYCSGPITPMRPICGA